MNMDKFVFSVFMVQLFWHIQSFPIIRFNICFFLKSWYIRHIPAYVIHNSLFSLIVRMCHLYDTLTILGDSTCLYSKGQGLFSGMWLTKKEKKTRYVSWAGFHHQLIRLKSIPKYCNQNHTCFRKTFQEC